ncbi:MAG: hypothetical protein ABIP75_02970 [Pyrinomonadaceae bacterium]
MPSAYQNDGIEHIYQLLFCDNLKLFSESHTAPEEYPWDVLFATHPENDQLAEILHNPELETRPKILAARMLSDLGVVEPTRKLMGVVIEVGMAEGLDVLAAYEDGSARYINYTGKLIVWDTRTAASDQLIQQLFAAGTIVLSNIGPGDGPRRPSPAAGTVRLNFLVSDGLYFGEGPYEVLQQDQMGGPVINAAVKLMGFLTEQTDQ